MFAFIFAFILCNLFLSQERAHLFETNISLLGTFVFVSMSCSSQMIAPVLWFLGGNFEAAQSLQMMIVLVCIASPSSLSLVYCCVSPKMIQLFGVRIACVASSYRSILSVGNAVMLARAQLIVIFSVPKMAYPNQGRNCLKVLKSIDDLCLLVMVGLF